MKEKLVCAIATLFILAGLVAAALVWLPGTGGLGLTNLNNTFVFGLWIIADLTLIALGSSAFCMAILCFLFKQSHMRPLLPLSVALGLLCYGAAGFILLLEIGQPLRFWFPFRHPNFVSMLTEITFCITLYSAVLLFEFAPIAAEHKKIARNPLVRSARQRILFFLPLVAGVGIALSLLHQGSLGGVYGVLFGRPFAWRPGLALWPWTFVLFLTSAMAAGPLFMALVAGIIEKAGRVSVLSGQMLNELARFGAIFLGVNLALRVVDLALWALWLLPQQGLALNQMFHGAAFGKWLLVLELGPGGLIPLLILANSRLRRRSWFFAASVLACLGLIVNRYIINLQTLAVPTLPFEGWESYHPNLIEVAPVLLVPGLFILVLRFLFKQNLLFERGAEPAAFFPEKAIPPAPEQDG